MIHQNTLRYSLYVTVGLVILTLTGIFSVFEGRVIIEEQLNFDTIVLVLMLGSTAYLVALPAMAKDGINAAILNGVISSLIVGVSLAVLVLVVDIDVANARFMFANLTEKGLNSGTLTFGETVSFSEGAFGGLIKLLLFSGAVGVAMGMLVSVPKQLREVLTISAGLMIVFGLTVDQMNSVITLADALVLTFIFVATYALGWRMKGSLPTHLGAGIGFGVVTGLVLAAIARNGGLDEGGILIGGGDMPIFLEMTVRGWRLLAFLAIMGVFGAAGMLISGESKMIHNSAFYFIMALLLMGIMSWQNDMTLLAALLTFGLMVSVFSLIPQLGERTEESFEEISKQERRTANGVFLVMAAVVLMVAPQFMGSYLSNVFNLIALYTIMGIGLNILVGYAGLLDLGFVAAFAIGAYTLGLLTTPNWVTCGGVYPDEMGVPFMELQDACTYTLNFWLALPFSIMFSALAGVMLGIPVLRLRGDYFAIVTLGFGEIIHRIIKSSTFKPILGGPGGIPNIPSPKIDLTAIHSSLFIDFSNSTNVYYLFLFGLIIIAFVVNRLASSRLGRAWRAIRADEDVAQAIGIELVRTKLWAFAVSAAFAGFGGAIFAGMLQGVFPDSFTLMVSINVLSLIIIGGMGSVPGVFVGALLLVGLPELLRELKEYRMLSFGVLLVTVMLVKSEGLLPPKPAKLSERAEEPEEKEKHYA